MIIPRDYNEKEPQELKLVEHTKLQDGDYICTTDINEVKGRIAWATLKTIIRVWFQQLQVAIIGKTIDANHNIIKNIGNAELSGGIDAKKIADGSVDNSKFKWLHNVRNDIQYQIDELRLSAAVTAHKLHEPREIKFEGGVTGITAFDGSENIRVKTIVRPENHIHEISHVNNLTTELASKIGLEDTAHSAYKLATPKNIVLTGAVTGSASFDGASDAIVTTNVADDSHNHIISNIDGLQNMIDNKLGKLCKAVEAETADALAKPITLHLTGDIEGTVTFDGSQDIYMETRLSQSLLDRFVSPMSGR